MSHLASPVCDQPPDEVLALIQNEPMFADIPIHDL